MTAILFIAMLVFISYSGGRAVRESTKTKTLSDFFSFGPETDPSVVRRAFQATNISFTTAFVSLYLFAFLQGSFAFATPFSFFLGIFAYAFLFLPRQITVLASGQKYPELLARAADAPKLRVFVALFVILSLWMFTFVEVQGLHLFLGQLFKDSPAIVQITPIILVCAVAFYVSRNGYRATTSNDRLQMLFIFIGAIAIFVLTLLSIHNMGWKAVFEGASIVGNPFGSVRGAIMFLLETLLGFLFSQLLYYDNWQRLSFWVQTTLTKHQTQGTSSVEAKVELKTLEKNIRYEYMRGSLPMLLVFCVPIILGFANMASGTKAGDLTTLSSFFRDTWNGIPIAGPVLVILSFIFMMSALISTAESYVIAMANCLIEDVLAIRTKDLQQVDGETDYLEAGRILTAVIAVSFVPFLLLRPNFETLFIYLFYSANALVGPLVLMTFGKKFMLWGVVAAVIFGFAYPAIPLILPSYAAYAPYPGIVSVIASLALAGVASIHKTGKWIWTF